MAIFWERTANMIKRMFSLFRVYLKFWLFSICLNHWGGSNVCPRSMFWAEIRNIRITIFHLKKFPLLQPWNIDIVRFWPLKDQRWTIRLSSTWKVNNVVTVNTCRPHYRSTMDRKLTVFQPDFHFTCCTIDSSDFWSFRGQKRTICYSTVFCKIWYLFARVFDLQKTVLDER